MWRGGTPRPVGENGEVRWPRPWLTVSVAVLVVVAVVLVLERPGPPRGRALSADCLPLRLPTSVAGINALIERYHKVPGFVGADVGADALLQDGRRLWFFGDTLRGAGFDGQRFVRNSMLLFGRHCASVVLPADHGAVIPDRADGVGYWPMSVAVLRHHGYDVVGVGAQRVEQTGTGPYDFDTLGPAVAEFVVPAGRPPEFIGVHDVLPDDPSRARPMWGAAIAVHYDAESSWVYLYGTAKPEHRVTFGWSLHLARARLVDVTDPSRWAYWDGRAWQQRADRAVALIPAQGGVSQVLSVFERDGAWYAVSKRDEVLGTDLVVWKAPAPTGPFVAAPPVARIPSKTSGVLRYMPLAHPDLLPRPGHVVVSYSRNVTNIARIPGNPDLYRPKFLEIALP